MKLRGNRAGSSRKDEERAHWTTNIARYTMLRESQNENGTTEDLRDAIARSSGLSSEGSRA